MTRRRSTEYLVGVKHLGPEVLSYVVARMDWKGDYYREATYDVGDDEDLAKALAESHAAKLNGTDNQ
jgi:hypothetical protein